MNVLNRMTFAPDDEQGGGFSVEDAVAKLGEQRAAADKTEQKPVKEAPVKAAATAEIEPEEAPEPGDTEGDEESTAEKSPEEKLAAQLASEQATPAADTKLPFGWSEAERELWSSLTPEVQARLEEREKARDSGIRKRLSEADSAKKQADTVAEQLKAERQRLAPILQSTQNALLQKLVDEFPEVDPRNPASVTRFALEHHERYPAYDALWKQIGAVAHQQKMVEAQQQQREEAEFNTFAETRVTRLLELDETLKDPANSAAFEKEIVEYLMTGNGYDKIDPQRIKHYTAEELLIARDGMKYRKAMAALKKAPPAKTPTVARPGAGVEGGKTEKEAALEKRLKKSGSVDDAVELMRIKRAG